MSRKSLCKHRAEPHCLQKGMAWLAYEDFLRDETYLQGSHICCTHHYCY